MPIIIISETLHAMFVKANAEWFLKRLNGFAALRAFLLMLNDIMAYSCRNQRGNSSKGYTSSIGLIAEEKK